MSDQFYTNIHTFKRAYLQKKIPPTPNPLYKALLLGKREIAKFLISQGVVAGPHMTKHAGTGVRLAWELGIHARPMFTRLGEYVGDSEWLESQWEKVAQGACDGHHVDAVTLESIGEQFIKIILPGNHTRCYVKSTLLRFMRSNIQAEWIQKEGTDMDDMGYGGKPGKQQFSRTTDGLWFTRDSISLLAKGTPTHYTFHAKIFKKNQRIGNLEGIFGVSMNHGQLPGFTVYAIVPNKAQTRIQNRRKSISQLKTKFLLPHMGNMDTHISGRGRRSYHNRPTTNVLFRKGKNEVLETHKIVQRVKEEQLTWANAFQFALKHGYVPLARKAFRNGDKREIDNVILGHIRKRNYSVIRAILKMKTFQPSLLCYAASDGNTRILDMVLKKVPVNAADGCAIVDASKDGRVNNVRHLIRRGANVGVRQNKSICLAADNGHARVVLLLLQNGADIHANRDEPIINAAEGGHQNVVKLLIRHGAVSHANQELILGEAAEYGSTDIIKMLIDRGVNIQDNDNYALKVASEKGHVSTARLLLQHGADIHAEHDYALRISSEYGHTGVVRLLLQHGADVHALNDYALRMTSEDGRDEIVKLLIEAGADVHAENDDSLHVATENGHEKVVKLLIEAGANVNASDEPLENAIRDGNHKIVKRLIDAGADIHTGDNRPLHIASNEGNDKIVRLLVNAGADIEDGRPLQLASNEGFLKIVKILVNAGTDVDVDNGFPLQLASERGRLGVVKYLVREGANVHLDDDAALRLASENGHLKIVQFLVRNGANIHAKDNEAIIKAVENDHFKVFEYLYGRGASVHARDMHIYRIAEERNDIRILSLLPSVDYLDD